MNELHNGPHLWHAELPVPTFGGNKYDRGQAIVFAAPDLTGATRLAASACSRVGAGLVTVLAGRREDVYRASLPAEIMVTSDCHTRREGVAAVLVGPGGVSVDAYLAIDAIDPAATLVIDAGALATRLGDDFADRILTPHDREFARVFPDVFGTREERARIAAEKSGAVVVLKGAETVVAAPDGRIVLNTTASPYLAKAGTGDVLAGLITGLAAQGMNSFDASCAAVWMHGEAGRRIGPGLIPTDIINSLPQILGELLGPKVPKASTSVVGECSKQRIRQ